MVQGVGAPPVMAWSRLLPAFGGGNAASSVISPQVISSRINAHSNRQSPSIAQRRAHSMASRVVFTPVTTPVTTQPWLLRTHPLSRCTRQAFALHADTKDHMSGLRNPTTAGHLEADAPNTFTVACPQLPGLAGSSLKSCNLNSKPAELSPLASLTKVLLTLQPTSLLRTFGLRGQGRLHGPTSVLLMMFAIFAAVAAALRRWMIQRVRRCRSCRGYGVMRCRVCDGVGKVEWQAKFGHTTCCPLCFSKRLMTCPDCGGLYHKPLFQHACSVAPDPFIQEAYEKDLS